MTQRSHVARLLDEVDAIDERITSLTAGLDDRQLNWQPPDGGWSIGQVFEHLVVANDSYLDRIWPLVREDNAPRHTSVQAEWRPTLMGRMLVGSFRSPRKLPAPRIYRPSAQPRARVVAEFRQRQHELRELLHAAADLNWRRIRTTSPVTPLIRLNLGDCFTIVVVHAQRHLGQIERLREGAGFPASTAGV
ncbi:MAG: DinB family protein [Chloroflexota bacterium]|nr:DinB family protein [Chloroflexota bacterium]